MAQVAGSAIPQARSLDSVREVVLAASAGQVDREKVVTKTHLSLRHAAYHLQAATTLGWLAEEDKAFQLTQSGRALLETSVGSHDEALAFAAAVAHSPAIRRVAPDLLNDKRAPSLAELTQSIQKGTGLAFSTAEARAQTLVAWRRRILKALRANTQLPLPSLVPAEASPSLLQLRMENWKSFETATLEVEPLTILIGANASGKSNALDALILLQRLAIGTDIRTALSGGPSLNAVRGGLEWAARAGMRQFTLGVLVASADDRYEYTYSVSIEVSPQLRLLSESLERSNHDTRHRAPIWLFRTDPSDPNAPSLITRLYNAKAGTKREAGRSTLVLTQLSGVKLRKEIGDGIGAVLHCLRSILTLDPVPSRMRDYCALSDILEPDGSNAAGILAALDPETKGRVERALSDFASRLPERGVEALWAEPIGKFKTDAMLYARERWSDNTSPIEIDSRGMSDGTLRFVAILTALLTRPSGSILVVEEIDNGFHPARASLLLETLKSLGTNRKVDVIVTTHNQALLDAVGPELIPSVVVAHRQTQSGASELVVLDDLAGLPRLLASGPLGRAAATGRLEALLHEKSTRT